jgi:glutaminase
MEPSNGPSSVSTGHLPPGERVRALVDVAHKRFKANQEGENAAHYPALAAVPRDLFGVCLAGVDGAIHAAGDAENPFTIMSVAKPFVLALVCQALGAERVRAEVGVNATGLPFNSVMALELHADRLTNPMVNTGGWARPSPTAGSTRSPGTAWSTPTLAGGCWR